MKDNIILLCEFCHRRVHSSNPGTILRQLHKQADLLCSLQLIAPSLYDNGELYVDWNIIEELRKIMVDEIDMIARCLDCDKDIGFKSNRIVKLLCDNCRDTSMMRHNEHTEDDMVFTESLPDDYLARLNPGVHWLVDAQEEAAIGRGPERSSFGADPRSFFDRSSR